MKKIFYLFALTIILTPFFANICFAQEAQKGRPLEVEYPIFFGGEKITDTNVPLPEYIRYIFFAFLVLSGLVGLGVLIWAGFRYLTSAGRPEIMKESKERILSVFIGMAILFISWMILNTINPELLILKTKPLAPTISDIPSGALLCRKKIDINRAWQIKKEFINLEKNPTEENIEKLKEKKKEFDDILINIELSCSPFLKSSPNLGANIGKYNYLYLVPSNNDHFFAVLYEDIGWKGRAQIFMSPLNLENLEPVEHSISLSKTKSIYLFKREPFPDKESWKVVLYSEKNFNTGLDPSIYKYKDDYLPGGWIEGWGVTGPIRGLCSQLGKCPNSIKIIGNLVVIMGKASVGSANESVGDYIVLKNSETDLTKYKEITSQKPCADETQGFICPYSEADFMIIAAYKEML